MTETKNNQYGNIIRQFKNPYLTEIIKNAQANGTPVWVKKADEFNQFRLWFWTQNIGVQKTSKGLYILKECTNPEFIGIYEKEFDVSDGIDSEIPGEAELVTSKTTGKGCADYWNYFQYSGKIEWIRFLGLIEESEYVKTYKYSVLFSKGTYLKHRWSSAFGEDSYEKISIVV